MLGPLLNGNHCKQTQWIIQLNSLEKILNLLNNLDILPNLTKSLDKLNLFKILVATHTNPQSNPCSTAITV